MQAPSHSASDAAVPNGGMPELRDRIRQCRIQLDLTQGQLGERVGVSPQAVTQWESGDSKPSRKSLLLLADVLNVSIDYLLNGDILPPRDGRSTVHLVSQRGRVVPMFSQQSIAENAGIEGL